MFDAKPQLKALTVAGLEVGGQVKDGQLAGWLYRPQNAPKRLAELVQMRLDEQLPEGDPNQLQLGDESSLAASDAWYTHRATTAALGMLEPGTLDVFTSIETPLLATLSSMELQGVAIDREFLQGLADDLTERIRTYEQEAFDAIGGTELNLGSPKQLQVRSS